MQFYKTALPLAFAAALLAGCTGSNVASSGSVPSVGVGGTSPQVNRYRHVTAIPAWRRRLAVRNPHLRFRSVAPLFAAGGKLYASGYYATSVYGWSGYDAKKNLAPTCSVTGYESDVNGIATDPRANLIVPGAATGSGPPSAVTVYQGPTLCGSSVTSITDNGGESAGAASLNAVTGKIAVANIYDYTSGSCCGNLVVCSISAGCGAPLAMPASVAVTGFAAGVAMDAAGDCWLSVVTSAGASLVYWAGCAGTGVVASGTSNPDYAGLFVDGSGNLGSIDLFNSTLYIYSGCKPACTLINSYPLMGASAYGNINHAGNALAVGDWANGSVDVYTYPGIVYEYSINTGLSSGDTVESGIFSRNVKPL